MVNFCRNKDIEASKYNPIKIPPHIRLFALLLWLPMQAISSDLNYWDKAPEQIESYTQKDTLRLKLIYGLIQYNNMRNIQENAALLAEAEQITEQIALPEYQIKLLINQGEQLTLAGDYKNAMIKLLEALEMLEDHPNTEDFVHLQIARTEVLREQKIYEKALEEMGRALAVLDPERHPFLMGWAHMQFANIFTNLYEDPRYIKAEQHLDEAEKFFSIAKTQTGLGLVAVKRARYFKNTLFSKSNAAKDREGVYNRVLNLADEAMNYYEPLSQSANIAYAEYTKATAASIMGLHESSIPFYKAALKSYQKSENLFFLMKIHQHLFVAYSILGNQQQAMTENREFVKIKDSIFGMEKRQLIAEAETKFETERIQSAKEKAEIESQRNRYYLIGLGIMLLLLLSSGIFYIGRSRAQKKAELIALELGETQKRLALEKQYRDSELKALKAQMNPHFIFNALNSIQEYIILNEKELAGDYLGKFADLMRKYLNYSDAGFISLQEEVDTLAMYLELEAIRFEDSLSYNIEIDPELPDEFVKIPTMLIQPYVENAIKHGLLHKKQDRQLKVDFAMEDAKTVRCIIEDNGVGRARVKEIQQQTQNKRKGFATKATQSRLELLNYQKSQKIGVETIDLFDKEGLACGTRVALSIPIKKEL